MHSWCFVTKNIELFPSFEFYLRYSSKGTEGFIGKTSRFPPLFNCRVPVELMRTDRITCVRKLDNIVWSDASWDIWNSPLSSLKHAPRDCKTVIKVSFTIKEGWNSKRLLRNFLFFIVKWNFESSVAFSQLKPCQNVAKKLFVRNNSLCLLWVLPSGCSP